MALDPTPKLDEEGRGYRVPNGGVYSTLGDLASCEYTSRGYYYTILYAGGGASSSYDIMSCLVGLYAIAISFRVAFAAAVQLTDKECSWLLTEYVLSFSLCACGVCMHVCGLGWAQTSGC